MRHEDRHAPAQRPTTFPSSPETPSMASIIPERITEMLEEWMENGENYLFILARTEDDDVTLIEVEDVTYNTPIHYEETVEV